MLDRRRPLVLDVRGLGRRAGERIFVRRAVPAPPGMGVAFAAVPEGSPVELDLGLEAVVEGVLVSGTATMGVRAECARCLTPFGWTDEVRLQELFLHRPGPDPDEDLPLLSGDLLDIEPALRDAVVLDLPLAPLCRPDCPGLCPACGRPLADDPDHVHGAP